MISIDQAQTSSLLLASTLREHLTSPAVQSPMSNSRLFGLNEVAWRKSVLTIYKSSIPLFLEFLTSSNHEFGLEVRTQATKDALFHAFQLDPYVLEGLKNSSLWEQWSGPFVEQKLKEKEKMEKKYQESVKLFKEDYEIIDGNFNFDIILQNILDFDEENYDFGTLHAEISDELHDLQEMKCVIRKMDEDILSKNVFPLIKQLEEKERSSFVEELMIDYLKTVVLKESLSILECLSEAPVLTLTSQQPQEEVGKRSKHRLG
mgnify:CR=1 FL=1